MENLSPVACVSSSRTKRNIRINLFILLLLTFLDPLDLGIDDDQHDYDSVASDEDTDSELTTQNNNNTQRSNRAKV